MELFTSDDISNLLKLPKKRFANQRPRLFAAGMPLPIALPGQPRWRANEILEWLAQVPNCKVPQQPVHQDQMGEDRTDQPPKRGRGRPPKLAKVEV